MNWAKVGRTYKWTPTGEFEIQIQVQVSQHTSNKTQPSNWAKAGRIYKWSLREDFTTHNSASLNANAHLDFSFRSSEAGAGVGGELLDLSHHRREDRLQQDAGTHAHW